MVLTGQTDWDQLLQQSERLAARDNQGFPNIDRDVRQVEAFSSRLKNKAQRIDDGDNFLAATRLLAQEGVNPRALDRALQTVELKPTYEDVFQVESTSVEEYLQQVHEMSVITAIQEAQRDTVSNFESYMTQCMDAEWASARRQLLDASMADRIQSHARAGTANGTSNTLALQNGAGAQPAGIQLSGREKGYADVVRALNEADLSRQAFDAVTEFHKVAESSASDDTKKTTIARLWAVLESILREAGSLAGTGKPPVAAMLRGAGKFLEAGHVKHLQISIQANRAQANLGGTPSRKSQLQAYLRIKEKDSGTLDFDSPGGIDTTWQRVFLCLRSGYDQEAVEIAERSSDAPLLHGGTFSKHLQHWVSSNRQLPSDIASDLAEECERLKAGSDRASWQRAGFRYKFAVFALLSGNKKAAETLLREGVSVFSTIEDFMWYMVTLVQLSSPATQSSGFRLRSGQLGEDYKLEDLQRYIVQFPAAHYSQEGREPLLYATVLLLSLQFSPMLTFLAKDASSRDYRKDAPHFAIALLHHKALSQGESGSHKSEVGKLIHRYGAQFASQAPDIALEYYMLAAKAQGNSNETKAGLLRELLTESNAFGFLLGSGGPRGGALDKWMGSDSERKRLLEAVAYDCQKNAQLDWASELYMYAGAARPALYLLNLQLSDLIEPALHSNSHEEELENLMRRGREASSMLNTSSDAADTAEKVAFQQLQVLYNLLQAQKRGDSLHATQLLQDLSFVPLDNFRLQRCSEAVASLHDALAQRIPVLLLAAAKVLAATNQVSQLRTLVAFAGNLPQRISQGTFRELNSIYDSVS